MFNSWSLTFFDWLRVRETDSCMMFSHERKVKSSDKAKKRSWRFHWVTTKEPPRPRLHRALSKLPATYVSLKKELEGKEETGWHTPSTPCYEYLPLPHAIIPFPQLTPLLYPLSKIGTMCGVCVGICEGNPSVREKGINCTREQIGPIRFWLQLIPNCFAKDRFPFSNTATVNMSFWIDRISCSSPIKR